MELLEQGDELQRVEESMVAQGRVMDVLQRAANKKRQDWSLEALFDIFPLLDPLLSYTVKTLLDKINVLRDSVLMQAECLHFEAYVHVCTIMWRVVFKELRGLTNSKVTYLPLLLCVTRYPYL
jgi:hypothetical protein